MENREEIAHYRPGLSSDSRRKVIHECVEITLELVGEFRAWLVKDNPGLREFTLKQ
ncbi:MAG: hypothetical protein QXK88_01575 [Desulfurococcaceae archaeon]